MSKFPRKIVSNTAPTASTAGMYTTVESLQSFTAATGGMVITAVAITDNTYIALDDTAVSTAGGYIKLTGTGFASGAVVYINSIAATTTFTSSTELRVVAPANTAGTLSLTAFNTTGSGAIWAAGIVYSGFPTVTTSSYSNSGAVISTQLVATGDSTLVYSLQGGSTLPTGVTLSSSGLLSGTVTGISTSTVYTFTVLVNDAQLQTTQQLITLSVIFGDQYFSSTVLSLHGDGPAVPATIEILVVAGGGGGRDVSGNIAGIRDSAGGGGGGVIYNSALAITSGTVYPLSIGTGGASATNGVSSVWNTSFTASGGGAGGQVSIAGSAGGSGGGGANYLSAAGATNQSAYSGWTVYGNAGGAGLDTGPAWGAGGGGGAGAVGTAGTSTTGGTGGIGISNSITGVATYYAGGGAGGAANSAIAAGGTGGGGASTASAVGGAGTPNTGGGGGGVGNITGVSYAGGAGGSGVSVIAYPSTNADLIISSGLTYTMSTVTRAGYKVYTFTAGTGTITIPSNNNNTFKDSSTNNFTITRTGTPTQGTFTPFSQTGWSGYFNGGSYLAVPSNAGFAFGTGDFTIEAWVYIISYAGTCGIFDTRTNGNDAAGVIFYVNASGMLLIYNSAAQVTATTPLLVNIWNHVAVTRSGTSVNLWLNGVSVGSGTVSTNYSQQSGFIGASYTSFSNLMLGYISNLRVTKGTGIYTAAFTPPAGPLTAITNTSLLTMQSNRFKDNSTNNFTLTPTGTPKIQALSPFSPSSAYNATTMGGSIYFTDNTTILGSTSTTIQQFAAGDFTVEMWAYFITIPGGAPELFNAGNFHLNFRSSPNLAITNDASVLSNTSNTIYANTWAHIAAVRASGTMTIYINGVPNTPATGQTFSFSQAAISIGSGSSGFNGYISDLRILNGTALYTTAFTPPTAPLTAVTNTSLLLNATNAAIFDQTAKNDLTTVGSAQTSATQSKFGGSSMYFNGSTDYLTAIDTLNLQLGTGDFTIEAWVYLTTASTSRGLAAKGPALATTGWECKFNAANYFRFEWTASFLVGTVAIPITTWTHVAVVRSGSATGNVKLYVNGTLYATSAVAVTDSFTQTDALKIGVDRAGTAFFPGYVDDFRITKYARYTANFTAPTVTFLDQ